MLDIFPETHDEFVAVRVSGKLDRSDYDLIIPLLEQKIAEHHKVSLLWEMVGSERWTLSGLWEDTKFDVKHAQDFKRIAMVGEKRWEELTTQLMKPLTSAEVKYFDLSERREAFKWAQAVDGEELGSSHR